jgi:hypothetical protein
VGYNDAAMGFQKWRDLLWPLGGTLLGLLVMPLAIEQYPEFLKENRWPLPISVVLVLVLWVVPFFRHDRAAKIWQWASSKGLVVISLSVLVAVLVLVAGAALSVKLFRFHSNHLASVLRKKEAKPEPSDQKREESKKEPPRTENPTAARKKPTTKPVKESEPPAFAVAVEVKLMVPSPEKDVAGTGFWGLNVVGPKCFLRSADVVMLIRIKNLQPIKTMITAYNVYAMGGELNRIRMDINRPFHIHRRGTIPRNFGGKASILIPAPSGNGGGGFTSVMFTDTDFTVAAPMQDDILDREIGEHYIEPGNTVRGWAFFEYLNVAHMPFMLNIKISDDLGHTYSYQIQDEPGNPTGDALRRELSFVGPTVDLSSCIRQPHLAPLP